MKYYSGRKGQQMQQTTEVATGESEHIRQECNMTILFLNQDICVRLCKRMSLKRTECLLMTVIDPESATMPV